MGTDGRGDKRAPSGAPRGVRVWLEVGDGVELLGGSELHELGHLPAGSVTHDLEWLLLAPEGSLFRVHVESGWSAPSSREVRL